MRTSILLCIVLGLLAQASQIAAAIDNEDYLCNPKSVVIAVPAALGGVVLILIGVVIMLAVKINKLQKDREAVHPPKMVELAQSSSQPGQQNDAYVYASQANCGQYQPNYGQQAAPINQHQ